MRSRRLIIALVIVAMLVAAAVLLVPDYLRARAVQSTVVTYDLALAEAVYSGDLSALEGVATLEEIQRVANYLILLEGTGQSVESDLLGVEVLETTAEDGDISATVEESWRTTKRDLQSGELLGSPAEETRLLLYILVDDDGVLLVDSVEFLDDSEEGR